MESINAGSYRFRALRPLFTWANDTESGLHKFSVLWFLYSQERESHDDEMTRRLLYLIPLP